MTTTPAPDAIRSLQQAEEAAAAGDITGAIALYDAALLRQPGNAHLLLQLSYMHSLAGHYRLARGFALRAHATGIRHPRVVAELVARLRTFNEGPTLLDAIDRLLPVSRMPIPMLLAVAAQLTYMNLPQRAIIFLDEAKSADPDYPATLLARAQVLIYLGRFESALEDLAHALAKAPQIAQGWWLLAGLERQTRQYHHIDAIRRQLSRPGLKPEETALLAFALHKELDDIGSYAEAWDSLMLGCRAKRSRLRYDVAASERLFDSLRRFEPATTANVGVQAGPEPIFIVGMHRSGTTLLEQLLSGSSQILGIGELYDFTSAMRWTTDHHCRGVVDQTVIERARTCDLTAAGREYLRTTSWRIHDQVLFTDKLPSNFLNVGFIVHALPQARILHMVRDPMETCFSNLRELFSEANPYSYDMIELAGWYRHYRSLMSHWQARWPGRIVDVQYSALVRDTAPVMREVCARAQISFDQGMTETSGRKRSVVTASAVQVRGEIRAPERPKWEPYRAWLQPLADALAI